MSNLLRERIIRSDPEGRAMLAEIGSDPAGFLSTLLKREGDRVAWAGGEKALAWMELHADDSIKLKLDAAIVDTVLSFKSYRVVPRAYSMQFHDAWTLGLLNVERARPDSLVRSNAPKSEHENFARFDHWHLSTLGCIVQDLLNNRETRKVVAKGKGITLDFPLAKVAWKLRGGDPVEVLASFNDWRLAVTDRIPSY